jgi:hypothetical protein
MPASFSTGSASTLIGISERRSETASQAPSGEALGAPRGSRGAVSRSAMTGGGVR